MGVGVKGWGGAQLPVNRLFSAEVFFILSSKQMCKSHELIMYETTLRNRHFFFVSIP